MKSKIKTPVKKSNSKKASTKKKSVKKTVKKTVKKVAKKTVKKTTTKKKAVKKVVKKPAKKVAKKVAKKPSKTAKPKSDKVKLQIIKIETPKEEKPRITRFKYSIEGYGSELAWKELTDSQFKYWRERFDSTDEESDPDRELINHLRHNEGPEYGQPGYLGDYRNDFDEFEEYPFYEGGILKLELYSGDELVEEIEMPLTHKKIRKTFYDGFVDKTKKQKKYTKATVFAKTEDRGGYCIGEWEIEEDDEFSIDNLEISVETIQGFKYVSRLDYNDSFIENGVYPDNYNKDFDAWIVWS